MAEVTAVLVGVRAGRQHALDRSGAEKIVTVPSLDRLREAASNAMTPLLWIVDARAMPSDRTLPALREASDPVASLPVDRSGTPVEPLLGRFLESDVAGMLDGIGRRVVPLRHTFVLSLLVERELALALEPPDTARFGPYAGTVWTARLFAARRGLLMPESRVRIDASPPASLRHGLRVARTGVWQRGEALRELYRCASPLRVVAHRPRCNR